MKKIILFLCLGTITTIFCSKNPQEQKLKIIITSYNNAQWYKQNLDSVFIQKYDNYEAIYIDDCSTDNTVQLVEDYIKLNNQQHKWTVIKNENWQSQMANHYKAVWMCDDNDICLHLDGDDWLHNDGVFQTVNRVYSNDDVWLTCGTLIMHPTGERWNAGPPEAIENAIKHNKFREIYYWPFTHLRTFRAWLFKSIKLQDLLYKSSFALMSPAPDVAFTMPMVEMAASHARMIDEILYVYNLKNPLSQYALDWDNIVSLGREIRTWEPYQPLCEGKRKAKNESFDTIILLSGNEKNDQQLCQKMSCDTKFSGIITALFPLSYSQEAIQLLKTQFPRISFYADNQANVFLDRLQNFNEYIFITAGDDEGYNKVSQAIELLEKTNADTCGFALVGEIIKNPRFIELEECFYAYQPSYMIEQDIPRLSTMQVMRKNILCSFLTSCEYNASLIGLINNSQSYIHEERSAKLVATHYVQKETE